MNPHETYSQRIWRHFLHDPFARISLGLVIILFILAALAPFLAGSHALVRLAEGRLTFPVFWSLEPIEWRFLFFTLAALLLYFFRSFFFLQPGRIVIFLLLILLGIEVFLALHPPYNDITEDRDRPADFKLLPFIPYSPIESTPETFSPPSLKHLCGTDSTGRDVASRMLHGARTSLSIGFVAQGIALSIGLLLGGLAGYARGVTDILICRFMEIMECFPSLLLILVIIGLFGSQKNMFVIMAVIGFTSWTGTARLVRGEFLRLGALPFTAAAQALGAGSVRIVLRHLLPNALGPVLVTTTFGVASAILIESSLSFLGFGMQAPTPSWGDILSESRRYIDFAWWLAFFPGLAILITIMSYNFVGEGLRDAVDPRLKVR